MSSFPGCLFNNGRVLARIALPPILHLAAIGSVIENDGNGILREGSSRMLRASPARPPFGRLPPAVQLLAHPKHALSLQVKRKNVPHGLGFGLIHDKPAASCSDIVPERR